MTTYAAKREELREAELELMRHRERVAALRRDLPPGDAVDDYVSSMPKTAARSGCPSW
jgi:predicted dithiol-disulfide oxidoreductase (DUF899 family)